jgi:hypothetical protein
MTADRSVRSLSALSGASSNRVLNLITIADANADKENYGNAPLFESKTLNNSIILKHRLRADEVDLFVTPRALATKIIIPFQRSDLRMAASRFSSANAVSRICCRTWATIATELR